MNTENLPRITLYYRQGSSDKVYQAAIEPAGDLFLVNFAYGRRGASLSSGTKTTVPVDFETANKVFAEIVSEKKAKGYTKDEDGTPYEHSDKESSGILPQLLNAIEEQDVERMLRNDQYCAQEKFDGRHLLIRKQNDEVQGINKKGLVIGLPKHLADELRQLPGNFILDGEIVGDDYHVFDLLEMEAEDVRSIPYRLRLGHLTKLLSFTSSKNIKLVETSFTTAQKTELWQRLREENREGIVLKRLDAPYTPGRPNRGGSQLKFKFVATVSAIVVKINAQRSVELGLFAGRSLISCGNVSIPSNQEIPVVGTVVEVHYLYAYRPSKALFQPVFLRVRDDVEPGECLVSQLKYKVE